MKIIVVHVLFIKDEENWNQGKKKKIFIKTETKSTNLTQKAGLCKVLSLNSLHVIK
jgi:hypothetical protein